MTSNGLPARTPVACGALGHYDASVVEAIAAGCEPELRVAHRDRSSILMLDREPLHWRSGLTRGFAWSEGTRSAAPVRSWRDAACELNACGLVVAPGRRLVHSSVAGVAPVYHADCGEATYFASRIDPLVQALPMRFSVDWSAWASTLCLTHAADGHTPFAEVGRLLPFSVLKRGKSAGRAEPRRWPWAEIEPDLELPAAVPHLLEPLRAVVAGLPHGPVTNLLSGGWDSRLALLLLAEARRSDLHVLTLGFANGGGIETAIASSVTDVLGLPHEIVPATEDDYWGSWRGQVSGMEYQSTLPLFVSPLAGRLESETGVVADGLAADTLYQRGDHFITREMLDPDGGAATTHSLWRRLRKLATGPALRRTYADNFESAIRATSRHAFVKATARVRGHPAEGLLSLYLTRTLRGISPLPHTLLGSRCAIVTPFTDHRAAAAALRVTPHAKYGGRMYRALSEALNPLVSGQPSTNDPTPELLAIRNRDRRLIRLGGLSPGALREYGRALAGGPLAPHLAPAFRDAIERDNLGEVIRNARSHRAALGAIGFHLWHERYRDRLHEVDPSELLA